MATKKTRSVGDAQAAATLRLNVKIDADSYERLMIHCIKGKKNPGQLITGLINQHLREWRVQANTAITSASAAITDRPNLVEPVMESAAA
jgi:hypothetical protein